MKREELLAHLREGGKHSIWFHPGNRKTSAVPRHREINTFTAKAICRDLGITPPSYR